MLNREELASVCLDAANQALLRVLAEAFDRYWRALVVCVSVFDYLENIHAGGILSLVALVPQFYGWHDQKLLLFWNFLAWQSRRRLSVIYFLSILYVEDEGLHARHDLVVLEFTRE